MLYVPSYSPVFRLFLQVRPCKCKLSEITSPKNATQNLVRKPLSAVGFSVCCECSDPAALTCKYKTHSSFDIYGVWGLAPPSRRVAECHLLCLLFLKTYPVMLINGLPIHLTFLQIFIGEKKTDDGSFIAHSCSHLRCVGFWFGTRLIPRHQFWAVTQRHCFQAEALVQQHHSPQKALCLNLAALILIIS